MFRSAKACRNNILFRPDYTLSLTLDFEDNIFCCCCWKNSLPVLIPFSLPTFLFSLPSSLLRLPSTPSLLCILSLWPHCHKSILSPLLILLISPFIVCKVLKRGHQRRLGWIFIFRGKTLSHYRNEAVLVFVKKKIVVCSNAARICNGEEKDHQSHRYLSFILSIIMISIIIITILIENYIVFRIQVFSISNLSTTNL